MTRSLQQNLRRNRHRHHIVHVSWHVASLSFGLVLGIALAVIEDLHFLSSALWLSIAILVGVVALSKHCRSFMLLALMAGLLLGLWRGSTMQLALKSYDAYIKKNIMLRGVVSEDVSHGPKNDMRLQLTTVTINGRPMAGKVWVSIAQAKGVSIKRSDTVKVSGKLGEGFGSIAASMSPATLVTVQHTSDDDIALQARDWFASGIRESVPEPAASLGSGFLVGQHSDLPGDLADELKAVGLTHAVVASGSNLTILVALTRKMFSKASKYVATMGGAAMTLGFVMITGFSPSMSRAGLVTGLSLAAWYYGRRIHPMVLLPIAAAITAFINPGYIWGDIGWYLSFSAFAGVLLLAPLMQHYFWGKNYKPGLLMEILIGTVAAQIATAPIILFSFGTYSSFALLANMLVLPLIPLAMFLTFIAGVAGVVLPAMLSSFVGIPAELVMRYMLQVIHGIANLPGSHGTVSFSQLSLIGSYAVLAFALFYMWRRTSHSFRQGTNILIGERT